MPELQIWHFLISGIEAVLRISLCSEVRMYVCTYLVPVACVHNRGVSTTQGSGLEGFHCSQLGFFPGFCSYV